MPIKLTILLLIISACSPSADIIQRNQSNVLDNKIGTVDDMFNEI
jgi:hypothetical protein